MAPHLVSEFAALKKFFTHLSWLMVLNLLIKPAYLLVIDAKIQDALGPEVWGQFFPLLSLSVLLNIFLDAGLANHMTRTVAADSSTLHREHPQGWRTRLVLAPIYLVVLMGMGWLLGYRDAALMWLFWIGGNQALLSAVLYVRAGLQGGGAHEADAWVSVADRALLLVAMGTLLWQSDTFAIEWLLAGTTAALSLALGWGLWKLDRLKKGIPKPTTSHPSSAVFAHLKESWPYALLFLLMMAYHRVDAIMLERLAPGGAVQAGWYAMGYRLFEAANMMGFLFATLLLPYFTRMLRKQEDVRPLAAAVSQVLWVGGFSVAWVAFVFPRDFLDWFYADHLDAASPILPWLMLSFAIFAQGYVFSTLLTARGDLKLLNVLAAVGAVLNIGLNAWWISSSDGMNAAWGCAVISAGTQFLVVGLQTGFAIAAHPGKVWGQILRTAALHSLAAGAICAAFWRWADGSVEAVAACLVLCIAVGALPGITNYQTARALLTDKMNTFADS
jgi:O-antigen/teichoic acid export membrane protein